MSKEEEPVLKCPHCDEFVIIEKIDCGIFRHGVLKTNGKQIDPHSCKDICDHYIKNEMIHGCGKPFKITKTENTFCVEICDYI